MHRRGAQIFGWGCVVGLILGLLVAAFMAKAIVEVIGNW